MIPLFAALALYAAAPAEPWVECRQLRNLSACRDTSWLIDAPFKRALAAFTGKARTDLVDDSLRPLSVELVDTLSGPPDPPVRLPDGNFLFTGCKFKDCPERGAVVLTPSGQVVAVALLTNHFYPDRPDPLRPSLIGRAAGDADGKTNTEYSRIDIFVRAPVKGTPVWQGAILDWAKDQTARYRQVMEKYWPSTGLTANLWQVLATTSRPLALRTESLGQMPQGRGSPGTTDAGR